MPRWFTSTIHIIWMYNPSANGTNINQYGTAWRLPCVTTASHFNTFGSD